MTAMAVRGETIRHFGLRLRAKDGRILPMDVSVLHLAVRPPDHFVLAHILKPSEPAGAPPDASTGGPASADAGFGARFARRAGPPPHGP